MNSSAAIDRSSISVPTPAVAAPVAAPAHGAAGNVHSLLMYAGAQARPPNEANLHHFYWRNYLVVFAAADLWQRILQIGQGDYERCGPFMLTMQQQINASQPTKLWDGYRLRDRRLHLNPPQAEVPATVIRVQITTAQVEEWEAVADALVAGWQGLRFTCPRLVSHATLTHLDIVYEIVEQKLNVGTPMQF